MASESYEAKLAKGVLSEKQLAYILWLCDPEREGSKAQWAVANGLSVRTLYNWVNDRWFKVAYEQRLAELNISPDRIQVVIDALHNAAKGGDTKAASLYLQYVDRLSPKRIIIEDVRVASMSDEELRLELQELLEGGIGLLED
jgi:hypothetical protein